MLLQTVASLGGTIRPDPYVDARLSDGRRHVWIFASPDEDHWEDDSWKGAEDESYITALLGVPRADDATVQVGSEPGSEGLVLDLLKALAPRTQIVFDNLQGWICAAEDVLAYAADDPARIFTGPPHNDLWLAFADGSGPDVLRRTMRAFAGKDRTPEGERPDREVVSGGIRFVAAEFGKRATAVLDPATGVRLTAVWGRQDPTLAAMKVGTDAQSERIALEIVRVAAAATRLVVDVRGRIMTVDDLIRYAATDPPCLFGPRRPAS